MDETLELPEIGQLQHDGIQDGAQPYSVVGAVPVWAVAVAVHIAAVAVNYAGAVNIVLAVLALSPANK